MRKATRARFSNIRRFYYNRVEIYIPLNSRQPWIHVNGRAVLIATRDEVCRIHQAQMQQEIVERLKSRGYLK